jgi:hypothetical protein
MGGSMYFIRKLVNELSAIRYVAAVFLETAESNVDSRRVPIMNEVTEWEPSLPWGPKI